MNATTLARSAYASASVRTPKSAEYDVFAKVTAALKQAVDTAGRVRAIADNRQLWTLLAADVADPDNGLPRELRGRIFYLSEFVDHHSRKVLQQSAGIDVLVQINTAIMSGLRSATAP